MMQLLKDNVKICQTHKDKFMVDTAKVQELIGVRADQVIDYLAMCGDASDNVPGLPGIGPKTASNFLLNSVTLKHSSRVETKLKVRKC